MNTPTTNQTPENPPAFPQPLIRYDGDGGMSLRDWFAGQAMMLPINEMQDIGKCDDQDLIQRFATPEESDEFFRSVSPGEPIPWSNIELRAKLEARARAELRYTEADAMLRAREVTK